MDIRCINPLVLAYLGDAIYEEYIRIYLIEEGVSKVNELQKEAIHYVSAKAQAAFLDQMIRDDLLTEEEMDMVKRARNTKSHQSPKGCSIIEYKKATALEALIGSLKLEGKTDRMEEIINYIVRK